MAKHLNVELNFSANTRQAQQQLKSLQSQMDTLFTNTASANLPITKELMEAQSAAASLQVALKSAINQDTGKLDLLKFSDSIHKAGLDIKTLGKHMDNLGTSGQKAFITLTQSILEAEVPAKRTSALLNEMWTTLKNTARWQISSSIMHGFQGTLQSAMGYAQDLDKSLNNIRIVTGQNVDQMAKFAEQANKAAKALSTTTTNYTDAALIYYQQGLSDEEVLERTNVTIKMANVAGQTAEVVSDQMTAVWNNFYDGSKTLEYYADVMTALGAATASSTDEISTGLNKFAAVSNTVGLSYEYAASALATVTATTRQSADIVGTAFRTLFTRIQGLSLGETLDDGVTLNKYSEALNAVGVNIMDQFGQLKDMDVILDELGSKWQNISKEQQVGLAQTIGGARQYATLIALMDNWAFFQENLETSLGSEGELEKQADIYAESWEAAQKRSKAALQGIYDSLLDEDLFIGIADSLTVIYTGIEKIIDSAGGMTGVIGLLGVILTKTFNKQLQQTIENIGYNIKNLTGENKKQAQTIYDDALKTIEKMQLGSAKLADEKEFDGLKRQLDLKKELQLISEDISEEEKERLQILIETNKQFEQQLINQAKESDEIGDLLGNNVASLRKRALLGNNKINSAADFNKEYNQIGQKFNDLKDFESRMLSGEILDINELYKSPVLFSDDIFEKIINLQDAYDNNNISIKEYKKNIEDLINSEDYQIDIVGSVTDSLANLKDELNITNSELYDLVDLNYQKIKSDEKVNQLQDQVYKKQQITTQEIKNAKKVLSNYSKEIVNSFQGISQLIMGVSSLSSVWDTLNNEDMTFFEKFISISMSLSIAIPSLISGITTLANAFQKLRNLSNLLDTAKILAHAAAVKINSIGVKENTKELFVNSNQLATNSKNLAVNSGFLAVNNALRGKNVPLLNQGTEAFLNNNKFLLGNNNLLSSGAKNLNIYKQALLKLVKVFGFWTIMIGGLIVGFKLLKDNSPAEKIKKANEAMDQMKDTVAKATEEVSNLISTLNGFDSSYSAIQNMTKGTLEWLNASTKLHDEIKSIRDEYGLQEEDLIRDGQYYVGITESARERIEEQEKEKLKNSERVNRNVQSRNLKIIQDESIREIENQLSGKTKSEIGYDIDINDLVSQLASGKKLEYIGLNESLLNFINNNEKLKESIDNAVDAEKDYLRSIEDTTLAREMLGEDEYYNPETKTWEESYKNWGLSAAEENAVPIIVQEILDKEINEEASQMSYNKDITQAQREEFMLAAGYTRNDLTGQWLDQSGDEVKNINTEAKKFADEIVKYFAEKNVLETFNVDDHRNDIETQAKDRAYDTKYTQSQLDNAELNQKANSVASFDEDELKDYNAQQEYYYNKSLDLSEEYQNAVKNQDKETIETLLKEHKQMAERIAASNVNLNKGFEDIIENYQKYYDILQDNQNIDYPAYLDKIRVAFGQMFDVADISLLTEEFLTSTETLELMKQAAEGNLEALDALGQQTALSILNNMNLMNDEIYNLVSNFDMTEYTVGMSLDDTALIEGLNHILATTEDGVDEVQAILNSLGFEPEIDYVTGQVAIPNWKTETYYVDDGKGKFTTISETDFNAGDYSLADLAVPVVNAKKTVAKSSYSARINNANTSSAKSNGSSARSKQKKASDEIDRYHEIKEVIEDLEREMDRLGKAKDRAWGKSKLDLIDQEIGKVEEAIAAQKEYLDQISANIGPDQTAIAAYGATFDEMGRITNYEELIQSQINKYNSMITSGDEDAAEEQYEKFKKALEQYEETADLYEDEWEKLVDLQNEFYDKLLEKVEYTVELNIEISDTKLKYLDYLIERLGDDAYRTSEEITELFSNLTEQTEQAFKRINTYQEGIEAIFANHGANAQDWLSGKMSNEQLVALGFTEAEIEALIKYQEGLIEENKSLIEIKDNIINQITESFNGFNEEMQEGIDKISHLKNIMNSFKNIVDLVGKQKLGVSDETIANMNNALVNMSIDKLASSRTRTESLKAAMDELQTRINAETNEEVKADMQKSFDEMQKEYEAATEDMLGTWEETLQQINDVFNEAIDTALTNFERRMAAGYGSLDALLTASDRVKTIDEQYLSDYRQIYELSKLTRDINNSIDNTDNLQGKRELKELLNEINEIQNQGVQMNAYDLEYLQKKYDLRLAEIALEDAQNAKNQVRMTRDADGNWSYTYTADESAVDGAAQNYEDKLYALQETSNNYLNQISEQWIQAEKEWSEALASIYQDAMLSEEERQLQIDETNLFYQERFAYFTSEIEKATGNNKVLYEEDWRAYLDKTEQQIASNEDFQTSFNDTVLGTLYDGFDTVKELQSELNAAIGGPGEDGTLLGDLSIAYADWSARVDEAMDTAGIATEDFDKTMDEVADNTEAAADQMARSVENSANDMSDAFGVLLDNVDSWLDAYRDKIEIAIKENELLAESIIELMAILGAESSSKSMNSSRAGGSGNGGGSVGGNGGDGNPTKTKTVYYFRDFPYKDTKSAVANQIRDWCEKVYKIPNKGIHNGFYEQFYAEIKTKSVPFKTGGYTGEWGSEGRLAMLHEKELVLHEGDTENFLSAVNMIREITRIIDLNTLGSLMGLGVLKEAQSITDSNQIIEQEVTIHAEFPNATNHNEIEEAFNNLINTASQYANRKKI